MTFLLTVDYLKDLRDVYENKIGTLGIKAYQDTQIDFTKNIDKKSVNKDKYTFYNVTQNNIAKIPTNEIHNISNVPDVIGVVKLPLTIHVLTYNISWESMTGKSGWALCPTMATPQVCQNNVANIIDSAGSFHLIGLQEAAEWKKLIDMSSTLKGMSYAVAKVGVAEVASFWNSSIFNENSSKRIQSSFDELRADFFRDPHDKQKHVGRIRLSTDHYGDRPILILFFDDQKLVFINAHFPHNDQYELITLLEYKYLSNYRDYHTIIAADFNTNFPKKITPFKNNYMVGNTSKPTCCIPPRSNHALVYDHVLATTIYQIDTYIPSVTNPASDHLPVVAFIQF
ncbi:MAG: hypothetical protein WD512_02065 [Candidatus Paceibacterota bacterium]